MADDKRVYLFDSTLRDGAQSQGVDFTVPDKGAIARALDKLGVAQDVLAAVDAAGSKERPDLDAAFEDRPDTDEYRTLLSGLRAELDSAVTNAFSGPFLLAAALALLALVPVWLGRGEPL